MFIPDRLSHTVPSDVWRCKVVESFVHQQAALEADSLGYRQPMESVSNEVRNMVVSSTAVDQTCGSVQYRLDAVCLTRRCRGQNAVTVVYSRNDETVDELHGRRCRKRSADVTYPSQLVERGADDATHMIF